jgi:NFACT protein RNA binding domain
MKNTPHKYQLAYEPPVTIYMGRDKVESSYYSPTLLFSSSAYWCAPDEDLIKYAWPQDIWFHVDKLSSAHVYLRLPESISSWEAIPDPLLVDCAQLVKANSIEGDSQTRSRFFSFQLEPETFQETSAMTSRSYIPPQTT